MKSPSQQILDAIQILADNSVKTAQFDRTIRAIVTSCVDRTIGQYKCRYQDATIIAYASSADIIYANNTEVYILIPNGDMDNRKTIIGSVKTLGIDYVNTAQGDEAYDIIGTNVLSPGKIDTYCLNSNNINYHYYIYKVGSIESYVAVDKVAIKEYLTKSSSLIIGGEFKTDLPLNRQSRGHYGITYNLRFKDNATNKYVIRSYTLDEDSMIDNPYKLYHSTRQYKIFDIDGQNFDRLESIEIFNENFPYPPSSKNYTQVTGKNKNDIIQKTKAHDIEITNLQLSGAIRLSQTELDGVAISFLTPYGTYFTTDQAKTAFRTITAQVRIKGKLVNISEQKLPFFWAAEDPKIGVSSQFYNSNTGKGWRCLNRKASVQNASGSTQQIVDWISASDTITVLKSEVLAKERKYKAVVIYNNTAFSKEITIQNLSSDAYDLWIESDQGTSFYYDIGNPTLTCNIKNTKGVLVTNVAKYFDCVWIKESDTGVYTVFPETKTENTDYANKLKQLNELKTAIKNGTEYAKAQATNLKNLENAIKEYDNIQRILSNQLIKLQVNTITNFAIYKCAMYTKAGTYIGTAAIRITNSLNAEDVYSLVINEGAVSFKYNANGVAPNNASLLIPQKISALSFSIYDNLGNKIADEVLKKCTVSWQIPIVNTLLIDKNDTSKGRLNSVGTARIYNNLFNFVYNIQQNYDISKQNNQIKLTVNYKGMNLVAITNFVFAKQGQPGTNGTEYLVKILPNINPSDNSPLFPMITTVQNGKTKDYYLNYRLRKYGVNKNKNFSWITEPLQTKLKNGESYQLFKVQLWKNGSLVWQGYNPKDSGSIANDGITLPTSIKWSILKNNYDKSAFSIDNTTNGTIKFNGTYLTTGTDTTVPMANIMKCQITYNGKIYYSTIPIAVAYVTNANYRISLQDYTGFRYVLYSSDGTFPQYDSAIPFTFIVNQKIGKFWEDISLVAGNSKVVYGGGRIGNVKIANKISNSNDLTRITKNAGTKANQFKYTPAQRYSGQCKNNSIYCTVAFSKQPKKVIARINIPIHFLLNRYGLDHINGWDGNSIELNNESGHILAPQIGAGTKNNKNQFTGVLMGQVNFPDRKSQIGLLGYNNGERTIFLNSQNGSAIFGKSKNSQIIIDPNSNAGYIYSANFWKDSNIDSNTGLPKSYSYKIDKKTGKITGQNQQKGLLIDLTAPRIVFGNGNFSVDENGYLFAKGGGKIAGWNITDELLYATTKDGDQTVGLNSNPGADNSRKMFWIGGGINDLNKTTKTSDMRGSFITFDGHVHFGDSINYFDFNPNKGKKVSSLTISMRGQASTAPVFFVDKGFMKMHQWYITDNHKFAKDALFWLPKNISKSDELTFSLWKKSTVGFRGDANKDPENKFFLWAGWVDEDHKGFAVQGNGNVIMPDADHIYIGGRTLQSILDDIDTGGGDDDGGDSGGGSSDDNGNQGDFPSTGGQTGGDDITGPAGDSSGGSSGPASGG